MPTQKLARICGALSTPLAAGTLIALASICTIGFALVMQFAFHHEPCELCLWQRLPYAVAGLMALLAILLAILEQRAQPETKIHKPKILTASTMLRLCAAIFLIGAAIAAYHSGIERHWWQGATSCSLPPLHASASPSERRAQLLALPVTRCDEINWSFLGLTMANWNLPYSLSLAIFAWFATKERKKKAPK